MKAFEDYYDHIALSINKETESKLWVVLALGSCKEVFNKRALRQPSARSDESMDEDRDGASSRHHPLPFPPDHIKSQ